MVRTIMVTIPLYPHDLCGGGPDGADVCITGDCQERPWVLMHEAAHVLDCRRGTRFGNTW